MDRLISFLMVLWGQDDTPLAHRQWKFCVTAVCFLFLFHIAWSCGYFGKIGLGLGFAQASDLTQIQAGITGAATTASSVQLKLLRKQILDARIQECKAENKRYFAQLLGDLLDEYFNLTKNQYTVPDCKDLE